MRLGFRETPLQLKSSLLETSVAQAAESIGRDISRPLLRQLPWRDTIHSSFVSDSEGEPDISDSEGSEEDPDPQPTRSLLITTSSK